ncbi:MAG: RluA family pseudouridine synthase [Verrucomicrobia bacterium]|nr:RluA family pseudouridine synthase [Verrucomicrobiota bacterium]
MEIPILFEDEHLLALDKPSGLLTSPDRYDAERPNLMRLLHAGIAAAKPWAIEHRLGYLSNAHRLDFETSGVILLAKEKPALVKLADQFGTEKPAKLYLALVNGSPAEDRFTVDAAIGPDQRTPGRMRVNQQDGKPARTEFEVVERFGGFALLHCRPATGRTHQLRVHLRHVGLPIVGDAAYRGAHLFLSTLKRGNYRLKEGREERPLIPRLALHAHQLTVAHPVTGEPVTITAPLPKDFNVALKYLRKYPGGSAPAALEPPE